MMMLLRTGSTTMFRFSCFLFSLVSISPGTCFVSTFAPSTAATRTSISKLWMSTERRDMLKSSGGAAATWVASFFINPNAARAFGTPTAQSAANKANESYQGVYFDPNHPDGYRVLMAVKGSDNKATMTISDGVPKGSTEAPKTYRDVPVHVENNDELVFDFGFKAGPKGIKAKLSPDKQSLIFEDGNKWTKNYYKYDGIYRITSGGDPSKADAYRVLRKNGPEIILEVNDTGNSRDSFFVDGAVGSLFAIPTCEIAFYFEGRDKALAATNEKSFVDALYDFQRGIDSSTSASTGGKVVGQLSLQETNTVFPYGTITFPDRSVWTRI